MKPFCKKQFCIISSFILLIAYSANSQINNYTFSQQIKTYTPLASPTKLFTATGVAYGSASIDNEVVVLPEGTIPFDFRFNGIDYSGLTISSNGFITFGKVAPTPTVNFPINSNQLFSGAIAAAARDLNALFNIGGHTGNLSYEVIGSAPHRAFVVQWENFRPSNNTANELDFWRWNFQLHLNEDNSIEIIYDLHVVGSPASNTLQVGLRGENEAFPINVNSRLATAGTHTWETTVAGTGATSTVAYSPTTLPPSGLTFTWKPKECTGIPAAGQIASNAQSINSGNIATLYAENYSKDNGITLQWQESENNILWTNVSSGVGANSHIYTSGELTENAYFRCIATCNNSNLSNSTDTATIIVADAGITSVKNDSNCGEGSIELEANGGGTINWYSSNGDLINTGNTYSISLSQSTDYEVQDVVTVSESAGKRNAFSFNGATTVNQGLVFDLTNDIELEEVTVYPNGTGSIKIGLLDNAGDIIAEKEALISGSGVYTPVIVPLNFSIPAGTNYKLVLLTRTGITNMVRDAAGNTFPYLSPSGIMTITNPWPLPTTTVTYWFFYNLKYHSVQLSPLVEVKGIINDFPDITISSNLTICEGEQAVLEAGGGTAYVWSNNAGSTAAVSVSPIEETAYSVIITNDQGCSKTAEVMVSVDPLPITDFDFNINDAFVEFENTSLNADSYRWDFGDNSPISTEENPSHFYQADGNYTVTLFAKNDCAEIPLTKTVVVNTLGILKEKNLVLNVFPNPTTGLLNLSSDGFLIKNIEVLDNFGRSVFNKSFDQLNQTTIDLTNLPKGIYLLNIQTESGTIRKKISTTN
jgi:hypothetical protein